jgi:hypothetical protein
MGGNHRRPLPLAGRRSAPAPSPVLDREEEEGLFAQNPLPFPFLPD